MESQAEQVSHQQPSEVTERNEAHHRSSSQEQPQIKKQQEELIADFSGMFKRKGSWAAQKPKIKPKQTKSPNWLLQIPAKLDISIQDITVRRVMDMRRWTSTVKAQGSLKMIAAVCSCWNYLTASTNNNYLTISSCLQIISSEINLQAITQATEYQRFQLIKKILSCLSKEKNGQISANIFVKLSHPCKVQQSPEQQKQKLLKGLSSSNCAYIYLGYEDIFCPIGYDITPLKQIQAYEKLEKLSREDQELWIINSSLGKNEPSFSIKRWSDIQKDFQTTWPEYFDIKQAKQGPRPRPDANEQNKEEKRGTSNCIIEIRLE